MMSIIQRKRLDIEHKNFVPQVYCAASFNSFVASFLLNSVDNSHYLAIWDLSSQSFFHNIIPSPESANILIPLQISHGKYRLMTIKSNIFEESVISFVIIGCTRSIIHRFEIGADGQLIDFIETSVTDSPTRVVFDSKTEMLAVCEGKFIVIRSEQLKRSRKIKCSDEPSDLCFVNFSDSKPCVFVSTESGLIQGWSLTDGEQVLSEPVLSGTSAVSGLCMILSWTKSIDDRQSTWLITGSRDGRLWMFQVMERSQSNRLQLREVNYLNIPKQLRSLYSSSSTAGLSSCNPIAAYYCNKFNDGLGAAGVEHGRLGKLLLATPSMLLAVDIESFTLEGKQRITGATGDSEESGVAGVGALVGVSFSVLQAVDRSRRLSLEDPSELGVMAVLTPAFGTSVVVVHLSVSLSQPEAPHLPSAARQGTRDIGDLSFYCNRELPAESPLLVLLSPRADASVTRKGAAARPRLATGGAHDWNTPVRDKKTGTVRDMPLTFHSRIRSSGYGQAQSQSARGDKEKDKSPKLRSQSQTRGGIARDQRARSNSLSTATGHSARNIPPYIAAVMTTPQLQHRLPVRPSPPPILNITFSPDAQSLAVVSGGSEDRTLTCLSLPVSKHQGGGVVYQGHSERLLAVRFTSDSSLILAYSEKQAYLWRSVRGDGPSLIINQWRNSASDSSEKQVFTGGVTGAVFFQSDKFIAIAMRSHVLLYHYQPGGVATEDIGPRGASAGGRFRQSHMWSPVSSAVAATSVSSLSCLNTASCQLLIAATSDKRMLVLDGATGQIVGDINSLHSRPVHSIAIPTHPISGMGGEVFATAATDGLVALWDLRTSRSQMRYSKHINRGEPVQTEFSPCGRMLTVGSEDGVARQIDVRRGEEIAKLPSHRDVCCAVAYNPLHPQLVTGAYDGDLRFYTAAT